jgi:hypothetical protein
VFETAPPPDAEKLRSLDQIPRPFVIEPPEALSCRLYQPGEAFDFRLVLVGRGIDYLPYFLFTFNVLGRTGLGPGQGQFVLAEVHTDGPGPARCVYTAAGSLLSSGEPVTGEDLALRLSLLTQAGPERRRLGVHFLTPTRIRSEGTVQGEPSFQDLIRALLRRLSSLCYFHCGAELQVDFRGLIDQAAAVRTVESGLRWHEQGRFSGRQRQRIEMGGVVGAMVFEAPAAEALAPFLPLLAAGEWVHVGKGCVMGLGKYRVVG